MEKRAIETADSVTAISQATVALTRQTLALRRDDFRVTPNPVDDLFFSPAPHGPVPSEPNVLFVGRLQWLKGPDLLAKAVPAVLARHPNARFCFVGGDTNTAPGATSMLAHLLQLLPEGVRDRVEFTGFLRPDQTLKKYWDSTVCVFPSRWEGFGLVAAEAMACGKAVVVTDIGGFSEIISEGVTGLLVPGEDPQLLASAIDILLGNARLRQTIGAAAKAAVFARFQGDAVARSILHTYDEAPAFVKLQNNTRTRGAR